MAKMQQQEHQLQTIADEYQLSRQENEITINRLTKSN